MSTKPPKNKLLSVLKQTKNNHRKSLKVDQSHIASDIEQIVKDSSLDDISVIQLEKPNRTTISQFDDKWRVSGLFDGVDISFDSEDEKIFEDMEEKQTLIAKRSQFRASDALKDVLTEEQIKALQSNPSNEEDDDDDDFFMLPKKTSSPKFRESAALEDVLEGEELKKALEPPIKPGWRVSVVLGNFDEIIDHEDVEKYLENHEVHLDSNKSTQFSKKETANKYRESAALEDLLQGEKLKQRLEAISESSQQPALNLEEGFEKVRDSIADVVRSVLSVVKQANLNIEIFTRNCRRIKEDLSDISKISVNFSTKEGIELRRLGKQIERAILGLLGAVATNAKLMVERGSATPVSKKKVIDKLKEVRLLRQSLTQFSNRAIFDQRMEEEKKKRKQERLKRQENRLKTKDEAQRLPQVRVVLWKKDLIENGSTNRISIVVDAISS